MKFFLRVFLVMVIAALSLPSLGFSAPITYIANLDGASESPPNASPWNWVRHGLLSILCRTSYK